MKKTLLMAASCGLLFVGKVSAQNQHICGMQYLIEAKKAQDPGFAARLQQFRDDQAKQAAELLNNNNASKTTATPIIPVVFHIVLNSSQINQIGGAAGIAIRVDSQMAVINRDFNRQNKDSTLIPSVFKSVYGNMNIKFGLAHRKPNGTSTPGYEIVTVTGTGFNSVNDSYLAAKTAGTGAAAWDPSKYLNIWVINPLDYPSLLGITSPPSFSPFGELGVVLNYGAFGVKYGLNSGYFINGITGGRTLTHELGHYFELWHVWGDDGGLCPGNGGFDDGIADTPPSADANYGSPTFPHVTCSNGPNGDMFMNFMDYVDDGAMHMFTLGQAAVAQTNITGESVSLTQHPEILQWPVGIANVDSRHALTIAPNPATSQVSISFTGSEKLKSVSIVNMMGQEVKVLSLSPDQNGTIVADLSQLSKGMYMVQCRFDDETISEKLLVQ